MGAFRPHKDKRARLYLAREDSVSVSSYDLLTITAALSIRQSTDWSGLEMPVIHFFI